MQAIIRAIQAVVRRSPVGVIVGILVLTGILGASVGLAEQEQGFQNFLPDNEISATQDTIAQRFSSGDRAAVQISVYAPEGGDMLSADGIVAAQSLVQQLRADPTIADALVEGSTQQPAIITWGDLVLGAAAQQGIDPATLTNPQVDELSTAALAGIPEQQRGLLSATLGGERTDTSATAGVAIVFVGSDAIADDGSSPVQAAITDLRQDLPGGFEVRPLDIAALTAGISDAIQGQLTTLLGAAFGVIILILVLIYRRPTDVITSMLGLVFTIVWMQGITALMGPGGLGWVGGQSEMSTAIPILLVGLGVDYGIHLTMRYREERATGLEPGDAVTSAIGAVGVALVLATITTVVGFLTNLSNPLPPLQDFGVFAAVGVIAAFVIMLTFVPAVRVLVDRRRAARGTLQDERSQSSEPGLLGRAAGAMAPLAVNRSWAVLGVTGVLVLIGAFGATGLSTEFSQTEFFPSDSPALAEIERAQDAFQGDVTEQTQVLVTGDDLATPAALNAIADFSTHVTDNADVRAEVPVDSVATRLAGIQATIRDQAASGEQSEPPPGVDPTMLREFATTLLTSGFGSPNGVSDDTDVAVLYDGLLALDPSAAGVLATTVDGTVDAALVTVPTSAGESVDDLRVALQDDAQSLDDAGLDHAMASDGLLVDLVLGELQASQIRGLVITLLASMIILAIAFWARERKPLLGVLAILAVAVVVAWVFGIMAAVGIPFNVLTAMVSALAIGIGVPFGIHVVNRFLEDRQTHPDTLSAMTDTLRNTGGALVGSAVTTMAGFGMLVFSTISPFRQFGIVLALTIGLALLSSIIVLPAMLAVWARRHEPEPSERPAVDTSAAMPSGVHA